MEATQSHEATDKTAPDKCICIEAGHCPWHDTVTDKMTVSKCATGIKPQTNGKPCIYLGPEVPGKKAGPHQAYHCPLHGKCTLVDAGSRRWSSCDKCKDYSRVDDEGFADKWKDPLKMTDRNGVPIPPIFSDHLAGGAAFLVCGGPSLNNEPWHKLGERGIFSLGVNNVAGKVPVRAFVASDEMSKFHWGIFTDENVMKFLPTPKLQGRRGKLRRKYDDGRFEYLKIKTHDCPNVWGFERRSWLMPDETWFTEPSAAWGNLDAGVKRTGQPKTVCTMLLGLRILQYLGARRIFLLGVDFHMDPTKGLYDNYSFGEERDIDACRSNNKQFAVVNKWLCQLKPIFARFGFSVYNTNRHSHLRAFDYVPFETALEICRGMVPTEPFDLHGWYEK